MHKQLVKIARVIPEISLVREDISRMTHAISTTLRTQRERRIRACSSQYFASASAGEVIISWFIVQVHVCWLAPSVKKWTILLEEYIAAVAY